MEFNGFYNEKTRGINEISDETASLYYHARTDSSHL